MNRRGNKSKKVPNVKLRPPDPSARRRLERDRTAVEQCLVENSQFSPRSLICTPRPFKDVVITATGIPDKAELAKKAKELGGVYSSDLTDKVNYVIASSFGGAKYQCAVERGIPVMMPSWITDTFNIWQRGDDVDFDESVKLHRLPIFSGVVLSLTGIEDIQARTRINKLVTKHGGKYLKAIARPVIVTHLLCSGDEKTDKIKYSEKFNTNKEASIVIVWVEWFWDCISHGGRLREEDYDVRKRPQPALKDPPMLVTSSLADPTFSQMTTIPETSTSTQVPIHAQTAEIQGFDDIEIAQVSRNTDVTMKIWESILRPRGYEVNSQGNFIRSPTKTKAKPVLDQSISVSPPPLLRRTTTISAVRQSNVFAATEINSAPQKLRVHSIVELAAASKASQAPVAGPSTIAEANSSTTTFKGLKFLALGEAKFPKLESAIVSFGGSMATPEDDPFEADYIIVRIGSGSHFFREEQDAKQCQKYRTECWVERCVFEERICGARDHISFLPLTIDTPIAGAENLTLAWSGLEEADKCFIRRILIALGITIATGFSRKCTHLLCPSLTGAKYDKANEWRIPVVNMSWLEEMVQTGKIPTCGAKSSDAVDTTGKGKSCRLNEDNTDNEQEREGPLPTFLNAPELHSSFGHPRSLLRTGSRGWEFPPIEGREQSSHMTPPRVSPLLYASEAVTQEEINREEARIAGIQIPSSESPSPMKSSPYVSPVKAAPLDIEATKKLQDGLESLLGKRGPEGSESGRRSKRIRQRVTSHAPEHNKSDDQADEHSDGYGMSFIEEQSILDESVRVMYEDPEQRKERERLLNLLGQGSGESLGESKAKKPSTKRRSRPGF